MGWTSYHVEGYWKNGRYIIDRKAECDRLISQKVHERQGVWYPEIEVLKSIMIGRVYYAAVKTTNKDGNYEIWAAVFLTSTNQRSYNNFSYKDQDETCGPVDCCCPQSILNLLTETDSQYAKIWRESCWKYHDSKKNTHTLKQLPIGSKITFLIQRRRDDSLKSEDKIVLTKMSKPGKKKDIQFWTDGNIKWPTKLIPAEFEVIA